MDQEDAEYSNENVSQNANLPIYYPISSLISRAKIFGEFFWLITMLYTYVISSSNGQFFCKLREYFIILSLFLVYFNFIINQVTKLAT